MCAELIRQYRVAVKGRTTAMIEDYVEVESVNGSAAATKRSSGKRKGVASSGQTVVAEQPRGWPWKILMPVAVLVVALVAVGVYWRSRHSTKLTAKKPLVLRGFMKTPGAPAFEYALEQGVSAPLGRH